MLVSRLPLLSTKPKVVKIAIGFVMAEFFLVEVPFMGIYICITQSIYPIEDFYTKWSYAETIVYMLVDAGIVSCYLHQVYLNWHGNISLDWRKLSYHIIFMCFTVTCVDISYILINRFFPNSILIGIQVSDFNLHSVP